MMILLSLLNEIREPLALALALALVLAAVLAKC